MADRDGQLQDTGWQRIKSLFATRYRVYGIGSYDASSVYTVQEVGCVVCIICVCTIA